MIGLKDISLHSNTEQPSVRIDCECVATARHLGRQLVLLLLLLPPLPSPSPVHQIIITNWAQQSVVVVVVVGERAESVNDMGTGQQTQKQTK